MKKLIDADAVKAWIEGYAGAAEVIDGTNMIPADSIMQRIDEMPNAGCAREGSSVSQYCPIAEEAGREAEALRHMVMNLLARIFRDGGERASAFPTLEQACEVADIEAAEFIVRYDDSNELRCRIRELEAAAKQEGEMKP